MALGFGSHCFYLLEYRFVENFSVRQYLLYMSNRSAPRPAPRPAALWLRRLVRKHASLVNAIPESLRVDSRVLAEAMDTEARVRREEGARRTEQIGNIKESQVRRKREEGGMKEVYTYSRKESQVRRRS